VRDVDPSLRRDIIDKEFSQLLTISAIPNDQRLLHEGGFETRPYRRLASCVPAPPIAAPISMTTLISASRVSWLTPACNASRYQNGCGGHAELHMRKAAREVTIVAIVIAAIAIATGAARLVGHKLDYPDARISTNGGHR
jgi:hypothetical protein